MSRQIFLAIVLVGCALGCSRAQPGGTAKINSAPSDNGTVQSVDELVVGQPIKHGNLTIFPVASKTARTSDVYITLDQGLKDGKVEVHEMGSTSLPASSANIGAQPPAAQSSGSQEINAPAAAPAAAAPDPFAQQTDNSAAPARVLTGNPFAEESTTPNPAAQPPSTSSADSPPVPPPASDDPFGGSRGAASNDVNRLLVINRSDKPLYLMPGEILIGGDQDRVIGQEIIIEANSKPTPVEVFCVEHGRWRPQEAANLNSQLAAGENVATVADSVVAVPEVANPEQAAAESRRGKFVGTVGSLNKAARLAVQEAKDQSEVWSKVAEENGKSKLAGASGAFTQNYSDEETLKRLDPYLSELKKPVVDTPNVVGVVVAINGKVESMDVFQSTPLFRSLWPKLLKSYALDAANAVPAVSTSSAGELPSCSVDEAKKFLVAASQPSPEATQIGKTLALTTRRTEGIVSFSVSQTQSLSENGTVDANGAPMPAWEALYTPRAMPNNLAVDNGTYNRLAIHDARQRISLTSVDVTEVR